MTPTRLREIAQQLVNNCSAYQEKIMQSGKYLPCKTCLQMAEELRAFAKKQGPHIVEKEEALATSESL